MSPPASSETKYHAAGGSVHHEYARCRVGKSIPKAKRREGAGGLPLCSTCAQLGRRASDEKTVEDRARDRGQVP